jgi:hypothetical protein
MELRRLMTTHWAYTSCLLDRRRVEMGRFFGVLRAGALGLFGWWDRYKHAGGNDKYFPLYACVCCTADGQQLSQPVDRQWLIASLTLALPTEPKTSFSRKL